MAAHNAFEPARAVLQGYAVLDPFSSWMTAMVCLGTGLAVLLSAGFLKHRNAERGEFYALMLFAAAGMSLLALSAEFITLFINLEVMSIATYALTAFLRRGPAPLGGRLQVLHPRARSRRRCCCTARRCSTGPPEPPS